MRDCAGARSTQARTPTCRSPPRWRSTLASTFYGVRVLSNSDRAPVFLLVCAPVYTSRVQGLVGSGSSFLLGGLQALSQQDLSRPDGCKVWIWVWFLYLGFLDAALASCESCHGQGPGRGLALERILDRRPGTDAQGLDLGLAHKASSL